MESLSLSLSLSVCANSIGTSKKLGKHNNLHKAEISSKKPQSKHQIFTWKPFNEKGRTTGPSLVKNLPLLNKEFTTIFS